MSKTHYTPLEEQVRRYLKATSDGSYQEYEYAGLSKDGTILYRRKDGKYLEVDPYSDFQRVLEEGITNGVFIADNSAQANPNGIVLRCEFIHELARLSGEAYKDGSNSGAEVVEGVIEEAPTQGTDLVQPDVLAYYEEYKDAIDSVCGEESYYKYSYAWLHSKSPEHLENLYSFRDMQGALTWFELSYILFFILKAPKTFKWTSLQPPASLRVTYIKTVKHHKDTLEDRLTEYKGSFNWMKSYLNAIQSGKKALPITVFWSLSELRFALNEALDNSYTWATVEITRLQFEEIITPYIKEVLA